MADTPAETEEENPKIGRPLTEINWRSVDRMLLIQCTGEEIAGVLGIDYDTLASACKREQEMPFSEYSGQKRKAGNASLRRKQWRCADKGNPTMLIWLGKNILGQKDQPDPEDSGDEAVPIGVTYQVNDAVSEIVVTNANPK